jgi:hypothetical protein
MNENATNRLGMNSAMILTIFLLTLASGAMAESKNFDFPADRFATRPQSCTFETKRNQFPADAQIFSIEAYGGRKVDFQIDQSGQPASRIDVAVNSPTRPVILIVGAFAPTIWNIGWTPGSRIVAVLARGHHRQAIAGLDKNVPVVISTYHNKGPCGPFFLSSNKPESLNSLSEKLFGRPVTAAAAVVDGYAVAGMTIPPNTKLATSAETPPSIYADRNAPLAGAAGIDDALRKGLLRKATRADAEAWAKAQAAPPSKGSGNPLPSISNAYVIQKKFTYPAGLYGAGSVTFFIDKGAPRPDGDPGHSSVYDFNTLVCTGPGCK